MSVEFFGVGGPAQIGSLKKQQQVQSDNKTEGAGDKVEFSSVLQDVSRAQAASSSEDTERAARIQELREQIKAGSYQPDLEKVSSSLLQFIVEGQ